MCGLERWLEVIQARTTYTGIDLSLSRIEKALFELSINEFDATVVKVAGTNGKGSMVAALNHIYTNAGLKVACYTSPHLFSFNERLLLNNKISSDQQWCSAFVKINKVALHYNLTYFETITLAAFLIISELDFDIILLEIGLGGRLDAVNAILADLAIITSIGFDHTDRLGESLAAIAYEKAGIIKSNMTVIYSGRDELQTFQKRAQAYNCNMYALGHEFSWFEDKNSWGYQSQLKKVISSIPNIHLDIAAGAIKVTECLSDKHPVSNDIAFSALSNVKIMGRCQEIRAKCPIIIDVSHNTPAVKNLVKFLKNKFKNRGLRIVFGCQKNKDYNLMLSEFKDECVTWYFADLACSGSASRYDFKANVKQHNYYFKNITSAFSKAYNESINDDVVVAFGSFFVVSEVMQSELMKKIIFAYEKIS
ncbi:MAG: Mur ligase family protein [Pseudomonadota bacterium]|nr:Mur ligase family protein [Pseudomonadota bacterium]